MILKTIHHQFEPFENRMRQAGIPKIVINNFKNQYIQLTTGVLNRIAESSINPIQTLPHIESFKNDSALKHIGTNALRHTVLVKLNGGMGAGMGLTTGKSLLVIKNNLTFLDIIAQQANHYKIPLLLMNSIHTRKPSLKVLRKHDNSNGNIPIDFLQHQLPKIVKNDYSLATYQENSDLEWYPPGHGDFYLALITSGVLDQLLKLGIRYAFISNADNLGAVIDPVILGYQIQNNISFLMEVSKRTSADIKGGHLAKSTDNHLILREIAQCLPEELAHFQNIRRHQFFNTNNLWIDLIALKDVYHKNDDNLQLPPILHLQNINPHDKNSPLVYQLETAIGSAISVFPNAKAIQVPRSRFAPVKGTNGLLAVRSDAYKLTKDFRVILDPSRNLPPPQISLDRRYWMLEVMESMFPFGLPSLINCEKLEINGEFKFGHNIILKGNVKLSSNSPKFIKDNTVIEGNCNF